MKKIRIKNYASSSFKGLKHWAVGNIENLSIQDTLSKGKNGTGKTTKLELVSFALNNKKGINGQTIDPVPVDGSNYDVWVELEVKENDKVEQVMVINKNGDWLFNDLIPKKATEYKKEMNGIFNNFADYFALLTNPFYFMTLDGAAQKSEILTFLLSSEKFIQLLPNSTLQKVKKFGTELKSLKARINKEIKTIDENLALGYLVEYFNAPENAPQEIKDALPYISQDLEEKRLKYAPKLAELKETLLEIQTLENETAKALNRLTSNLNFSFDIKFSTNKKGEEWFEISKNGVIYKHLNTAERVLIAVEFAKTLQFLADIDCFILIDDAEHLDSNTKQRLEPILGDSQVLAVQVSDAA